jgi:hypothetical protein
MPQLKRFPCWHHYRLLVESNLGARLGLGGYFTIPYAYLTDANLADDFWTVRMVAKTTASLEAKKRGSAAAGQL